MWNMTGDSALICSVDCLTHTSPHVGASLGLPATPISPPTHKSPRARALPPHAPLPPLLPDSPKCCVLSLASTVRRRWAQGCGAQPPPPASPLKDNAVYCICQASAAILCKSIAHLLPCTLSLCWCASFVWFCLFYLANWLMAEGWKQSSKNYNVVHSPVLCPSLFLYHPFFSFIPINILPLPICTPLSPFSIPIAKEPTRTDDSK